MESFMLISEQTVGIKDEVYVNGVCEGAEYAINILENKPKYEHHLLK